MTDKPKKPLFSLAAQADAAVREARRAAALRANLRRRKTQGEAREASAGDAPAEPATAAAKPKRRPSLFQSEVDAAVREARREASMRGAPRRRKD